MTTQNLGTYIREQTRPGLEAVGGFVRMCVLVGRALLRPPFQWREFILQSWFLMRVAFLPTLAVSIPLTVLLIFTLNILLAEFGAADVSGAGAAIGAVTGAVGYRYAYDAERGEFAHPVAMVLAGRDGRLARMLSPLAARGTDLRLALQESGRAPDGLVQAVRALCYRFDPATGRYTALVDRVMTGLALCSAALLAAGVLWLLRRERRRRRDGAAEAGHG